MFKQSASGLVNGGVLPPTTTAINQQVLSPDGKSLVLAQQGLALLGEQIVPAGSALASVAFTTGIDGTYSQYWVEFDGVVPSVAGPLEALLIAGGVAQSTGYLQHMATQVASAASYVGVIPTSYILCAQSVGIGSSDTASGLLTLFNPATTGKVKDFLVEATASSSAGTVMTSTSGSGCWVSNAPTTGVQFQMSSGYITAGNFRLYGVRNQ
ncbi:hypothetical protein [Telmatospirillum sp.]|uniref:hypothetical protein n=1 Tax=Telmatospirillum sp. TaxID=2079197 RepID=UPI00283FE206|nr:hypothetical protein [Telmatospirillum sp.]MDR3436451.1 hypothetical protein [Telmatospirillum sp.]